MTSDERRRSAGGMLDLPLGGSAGGSEPGGGGDGDGRGGGGGGSGPLPRWLWVVVPLLLLVGAAVGYLVPRAEPPVAALSPQHVDFGGRATGSAGEARGLAVTNRGGRPLVLGEVSLAGEHPEEFAVGDDGCSGRTLAAGESCTVGLRFAPSAAGERRAVVEVPSNAPGGTVTALMEGSGLEPRLQLDRSDVDFGPVAVGRRSDPAPVTLSNGGTAPLELGRPAVGGEDAGDFAVTGGCAGRTLAPGEACSVQVAFAPRAAGERTGELRVPAPGGRSLAVGLVGRGLSAEAVAGGGEGIDFGDQRVGAASPRREIAVANRGDAAMEVREVRLVDAGQGFSVAGEECTGSPVPPGGECTVAVRFRPGREGLAATRLEIAAGGAGRLAFDLVGRGVAPRLGLRPGTVDFGTVRVGGEAGGRTVRATNVGSGALAIEGVAIGGEAAGEFAVGAEQCRGRELAPGAECEVELLFRPRSAGARRARLEVSSDAVAPPPPASLVGEGVVPRLEASTESIDFGAVARTRRGEGRVELTSSGSAPVRLGAVEVVGSAAGDFALAADDCSRRVLAPGASCAVTVRFAPAAEGRRTAVMEVPSDAGATVEVRLDGRALPPPRPAIALSPGSLTFPARPPGSRSEIVTVTVENPGEGRLVFEEPFVDGQAPRDFYVVAGSCQGAPYLAPGGSCTFGVRFVPREAGERRARVVVRHNAPGGDAVVEVTGRGSEPGG